MGQSGPGGGGVAFQAKEPLVQAQPAVFQLEWGGKENDPLLADGFWGTVPVQAIAAPQSAAVGVRTGPARGWPEQGFDQHVSRDSGQLPGKETPRPVFFKTHLLFVLPRAILHLLFCALPTYLQVLIEQTLARAQ